MVPTPYRIVVSQLQVGGDVGPILPMPCSVYLRITSRVLVLSFSSGFPSGSLCQLRTRYPVRGNTDKFRGSRIPLPIGYRPRVV